jgi:predicted RNase H-like HicB family nuclease
LSALPRVVCLPSGHEAMRYVIEIEREEDDRWSADIPELPGVMVYGATRDEAVARCQALALRVLADRIEHAEAPAGDLAVTFAAA